MNSTLNMAKPEKPLIAAIKKDAEVQAESIIKKAENEAEIIRGTAAQKAEARIDSAKKQADTEAGRIKKRILSGVHLEIKQKSLRDRETIIDEVLKALLKRLDSIRSREAYREVLEDFIMEGIISLDSPQLVLKTGVPEKKLLTSSVLGEIQKRAAENYGKQVSMSITQEPGIQGGVYIETKKGDRSFDNRFSARVERMLPELRLKIVKMLQQDS